jgi:molybdate/tungstate transport system substrate-binding protein
MTMPGPLRRRLLVVAGLCAVASLTMTGCASPSPPAGTRSAAASSAESTSPRGSGPVNVLYAGSLVNLLEKQVAPRFHKATGYTFQGFAGGSKALAAQIKGATRRGDVFISASPAVNRSLQGATGGGWVSWYATFATSPLVLGYNPDSAFAADLATKPWYEVVTEPGFHLGSTDPVTDPKGALALKALAGAAAAHDDPALTRPATTDANVMPEESLVGRLQAGQLDAGFFYAGEAKAAGLPTVPLTGQNLNATYTITELKNAPDPAGAAAFIRYLLGPDGRKVMQEGGYSLVRPPVVVGRGLPEGLDGVVPGR